MWFIGDGVVQSVAGFTVPRRGDEAIEVKLNTTNRFGAVSGRVITAPDGKPLVGWSVIASADRLDPSSSASTAAVTTDADGRFRIERCPLGPLRVWARDPAFDDLDHAASDHVT